jgi:FlaA1/EpsC-like NDP-sugar epimerase
MIFNPEFLLTILAVLIIQLSVFVFGNLYKHKINLAGLGDFLQIFKVTVIAVIAAAAALHLIPLLFNVSQTSVLIMLNFYFLITLVAGSRILFHALNYVFKRETATGKKTLIYGADWKGMIALQTLLQSNKNNGKIPVGFLDDDPELEGKFMNGYPIYGGHWKLEGLVKKRLIDEIIMSGGKTSFEIFKRIKTIASKYNVPVHVSKINFETLNTNHKKNKHNLSDLRFQKT